MIEMDLQRRKFEELLPFYVNRSLDNEDMKFMQDYLHQFPELQVQVKFTEALKSAIEDQSIQPVSDTGWEKLLEKYHAFHDKPTLTERIKKGCKNWGISPAFAIVFSLLIAQSAAMLQLGLLTSSPAYRGLSTQSEIAPHLKITINPKTDYEQLVNLLRKNGCRVVSGPSETGELWIHLEEPNKLDVIKADLLNSGLIDEVLPVDLGIER